MDDRKVEDYRGHQIVASGKGSTFVGKAWKDAKGVLDVKGRSLTEVLDALKEGVDRSYAERAATSGMPGAEQYGMAFRKILPSLSDGHLAMIKAHYRAPNRSLTATELAGAAGYSSYGAANLQYGLVGRKLWEQIPIALEHRESDGSPIYTFALAEPGDRDGPEDQWVWKMRAEVAAAVKELGLDK